MGKILIEEMSFYGRHGHFEEEKVIGSTFVVSIEIETPCVEKASGSDNLADAIDYQEVYNMVRKEMDKPSNLLEHVAGRILDSLYAKYPQMVRHAIVRVSKINPAMGGLIGKVSIVMER